jgi:hypothetical protein
MQLAAVTANDERLFIKGKTDALCKKIFKLLNINIPSNVSTTAELIDRLQLAEESSDYLSQL